MASNKKKGVLALNRCRKTKAWISICAMPSSCLASAFGDTDPDHDNNLCDDREPVKERDDAIRSCQYNQPRGMGRIACIAPGEVGIL